jgi:hypothetical protein
VNCLESLLGSLRRCCETFPDPRRGSNATYKIADIGMAAFSVFFMQSPSFMAHQRRLQDGHGRSNCTSLFGLKKIPGDNHIRAMLDPAAPALLHPVFADVLTQLDCSGGLQAFRRLGDHALIALDGTEYFCSSKIACPQCSTRRRSNGRVECYHSMLSATLVAPDHNHVVPLEPEFIVPQDGSDKQDCESRAARRWLAAHGPQYARLKPVYLGDDLFANQPMCEAVSAVGGHYLFTCKPASHPLIQEYITGVELPSHNSFGHGKQNLAALFVTLNLLAFAFHTVCDHGEALWRLARSKVSSRAQFFSNMVAITSYLIFSSWDELMQTLAFARPPPQPP